MASSHTNRRAFLGATAGFAATAMTARSYAQVRGANDRIRIGVIGCGNRGYGAHMRGVQQHAELENLAITAVCDVWSEYRNRAAAKAKEFHGKAPLTTTDYREVLDRKEVDAVMIATCDFQHAQMLKDTAQAKKDVYCEKPVSMELEPLKAARKAVQESGVIVQIGTQRRSEPTMNGTRQAIADGVVGRVNRIEFFRNASKPNWYKRLSRLPIPASEVAWKQFLMDLPAQPYSDLKFAGWYGYREFCGGSIGQFLSHYADLAHFLTGATFPTSAVANGDTFVWDDEYKFSCRDQIQVSLIYPEGFMLTYSTNFGNGSGDRTVVYGTQGTIDLTGKPIVSREGATPGNAFDAAPEVASLPCPDHFLNWFQCLRSREQPVAPFEAGYQHSVACVMADQAMLTGRRHIYDVERDDIRPG